MRYVKILCLLFAAWAASSTLMATEGALSGKFTVNATGGQIVFSKGNLRATTTDLGAHWTWSFAANQWSFIGDAAANTAITGNGTVSVNGSVDLFGWSTAATYYGIHNSTTVGDYPGDFVDWGTNAITNGGNTANLWRTLTKKEWEHLLYTRANASNLRSEGTVNGVHGYILLPDNWVLPSGLSFTARTLNWTTNTYNATQWAQMEEAGAVFLPTAYWRTGVELYYDGKDYGHYWSASPGTYTTYAGSVFIDEATPEYTLKTRESYRRQGQSVRLAQEVPFDLQVCGTPITGFNCTDIASAVSGVTGTVSYNPSTNTLTLNNATITASAAYGIQNSIPNLTIEVLGTNTLVGANNWSGIRLDASTTITGGGKLSVTTTGEGIGIFIYNAPTLDLTENMTLTVTGGTTLYAKGLSGISGYGGSAAIAKTYGAVLTVDNAKVTAAFHGNDGSLNSGRHGGALEYLHALNMNGVSIISPSNVTYTAQQLDNLLDASTSAYIHSVYIGTPPQDTYYKFDHAYAVGDAVAPYVGDGEDLIVQKAVVERATPATYMQDTYNYGISESTTSSNPHYMLTFHVEASTANPAHVLLFGNAYFNSSTPKDQKWAIYSAPCNPSIPSKNLVVEKINPENPSPSCYEFVLTAAGDFHLYWFENYTGDQKAEIYGLRVIYENNALYQSIRNSIAIEMNPSTTTADELTTSFFRLINATFDNTNGLNAQGRGIYFTPYAKGTIELEITSDIPSNSVHLYMDTVVTTQSAGRYTIYSPTNLQIDGTLTLNHTIPRKVYKGGEYRISFDVNSTVNSYIRTIRFIPDHFTVTLNPNGGTVDPTELYYVKGISEPLTAFPTPTKEGLDFDNWYSEGEGDEPSFPLTPTADITYNAAWSMTITLMSDGNIVHQESYIPIDETRAPDSQSCEANGRMFDYWTADQDVQIGGALVTAGTPIPDQTDVLMLRNTIFTAHWSNPHGQCGDNLFWEYDLAGTLTITGTGAMWDFATTDAAPWYAYRADITSVSLLDGLTHIGKNAFYQCNNASLTTIPIPSTVTSIGEGAFWHCGSLTSITLPGGLTSVGELAFANCSSLTSITIPNGVTDLKSGTFENCSSLSSISIPNTVTEIGGNVFNHCSSLASITLPDGVTSIGMYAFSYCSSLTSITIPNGVTDLKSGTFQNCSNLTSIILPSGLKKIDDTAFLNCSSLASIDIPASVTNIGWNAFGGCSSLKNVTVQWIDLTGVTTSYGPFQGLTVSGINLHVPCGTKSTYAAVSPWSGFNIVDPCEGHYPITAKEDPNNAGTYYSTFYYGTAKYLVPADVEAYAASVNGSDLVLTKIADAGQTLPSATAVILKSTVGAYTMVPSDETAITELAGNQLQGVDVATAAPANCYVLSGHSSDNSINEVGFYTFSGTLGAHKAYLIYAGSASGAPRHLRFVFGSTTDVEQPTSDSSLKGGEKVLRDGVLYIQRGEQLYNAQGMRVE